MIQDVCFNQDSQVPLLLGARFTFWMERNSIIIVTWSVVLIEILSYII